MPDSVQQFEASLEGASCPVGLNIYLQALWFDGKGDWSKAHDLVNDLSTPDAARVHAYLHRKEGDLSNADYWYRRAGVIRPAVSLYEEWKMLVGLYLNFE